MKPPCIPRKDRRGFVAYKSTLPHYVLREDGSMRPASLFRWAVWYEGGKSQVVLTKLFEDKVRVSTIFTGLPQFDLFALLNPGEQKPVFETMVFGESALADEQERYTDLRDALLGHAQWVERAKAAGVMTEPEREIDTRRNSARHN